MKYLIVIFLGLWTSVGAFGQSKSDAILGQYWINNKEGRIQIYKRNQCYYGKIVWRRVPRKDSENPDPQLRSRRVLGITFLYNFTYDDGEWIGGKVYNINNGRTYSGKLWLEDGGKTLKMRGYIGYSLFGKTMRLQRVSR
ncbi:hypothetical protein BKI52_07525 [marine bacterium AO1-C]|nr:hypothetical protein BKI52_07525 [marine bacterium AO1-C]